MRPNILTTSLSCTVSEMLSLCNARELTVCEEVIDFECGSPAVEYYRDYRPQLSDSCVNVS